MALHLEVERRDGGIAVLHVSGRLDAASSGDFEAGIFPVAQDAGVDRLVLACGGLEYVASAGLRVLVAVVKALNVRKARLFAVGLHPEPLAVLKMTGFLSYLTVKSDIEECLA